MNDRDILRCQAATCSNTYGIEDSDARTATRFCSAECEANAPPPATPDLALTVTIPLPLYQLLLNVAGDAQTVLECNCTPPLDVVASCDGTCTHSMAGRALDEAKAHADQTGYAITAPAGPWAGQSPAFRAEQPWCGWMVAFSADSDCDTTAFGLERMVNINLLLTTADGRSRPASIVNHLATSPQDGRTGGILIRELNTTEYEPLDPSRLEFVAFEDIREIVVF